MGKNLLEVKNLKVYFPVKGKLLPTVVANVRAVDGVSFKIKRGETLALVGESGCGKSTTGKAILRMIEPKEGQVFFEGNNILAYDRKKLKALRREMQLIFQDPYASLNPRMAVGDILNEVLFVHRLGNLPERKARTLELLEMVGLTPRYLARYPHELSGGQRQRVVIARALAVNPKFLVCDEPVSALDVSIQGQIISLLEELQQRLDLTYLFIAHDLSVVKYVSNRVAVMYLGKIIELAEGEELYRNPCHPYTKALLSAIPLCDPDANSAKILLVGELPSPENPPRGCRFHTRCVQVKKECLVNEPVYQDIGHNHQIACHLYHGRELK